jgi:hypothetical protein
MTRISSRSVPSATRSWTSRRIADRTRLRAAASRNEVLTASESLRPLARTTSSAAAEASSRRTWSERTMTHRSAHRATCVCGGPAYASLHRRRTAPASAGPASVTRFRRRRRCGRCMRVGAQRRLTGTGPAKRSLRPRDFSTPTRSSARRIRLTSASRQPNPESATDVTNGGHVQLWG